MLKYILNINILKRIKDEVKMIFKNGDKKRFGSSGIDEIDRFWNIEDITPKRRSDGGRRAERTTKTESSPVTVLIEQKGEMPVRTMSQPIPKFENLSKPVMEYVPENPLIERVSVYSWHTAYSFYERFRNDARKYFNTTHGQCQQVKYFAYMPGYAQMSMTQRMWYFYWRDCVRRGEYLPTDSSYILLYVYEIINLPELIPPEKGLDMLCDIWLQYRKSYTKLDKLLTEWVCDYCLINRLELPFEKIKSFYGSARDIAAFKQFYSLGAAESVYASMLMARLNEYRWNNSKYMTEENRAVFNEHIVKGFAHGVKLLGLRDGRFDPNSGRLVKRKIVRDVFSGAVCSYDAKRRVDIECFDVENVQELGFIVTDMVKHCENRVRAYLGIRARLKTVNLGAEQREALDSYFDKELPCVYFEKKGDRAKAKSEYEIEKQKESARPFEVSVERAKAIEEKGWEITDRLVEYYEEEPIAEIKERPQSAEAEALDIAKDALRCIAKGDSIGFAKIAEESYMLPETLAECVNELCYGIVGDIGIEETDGGYRIIPDYEEEIEEWLNS